MDDEVLNEPETVWLMEGENMVTHIKEEPESDTVSDSEAATSNLKSVKKESVQCEAKADEPEDGSAHTPDGGQDVCSKLEIEDYSILEDSSGSSQKSGVQNKCETAGTSVQEPGQSEREILGQNKNYECHYCFMVFPKVVDLVLHTKDSHTGEKPFSCRYCKRRFTNRSHLNVHLQSHKEEKHLYCEHCCTSFTKQSSFILHMKMHTEEKPFSCVHCNKSFAKQSALVVHIRIHTGEKPFSCEYCNKCFTQQSGLISHRRTHTGEKPFTCVQCHKGFTKRSSLNTHLRTHTGE